MLLKSCLNAKVVFSRLVRIHFDHSQKRIQIFDFLHFPQTLQEDLKTFRPHVQGGYHRSISICLSSQTWFGPSPYFKIQKKTKGGYFQFKSPSPTTKNYNIFDDELELLEHLFFWGQAFTMWTKRLLCVPLG